MIDHQDRDQSQPPAKDLGGPEVQEAQDDAGIAGEPQPAGTAADGEEGDGGN